MPNTFAYLMLLIWPVVAVGLFRLMPIERALIWTLLGGYLILPQATEFNLPMIPALNKATIPNLSAFVICLFMFGTRVLRMPSSLFIKVLIFILLVSPIATALTNREPILFENGGGIPSLTIYNAISDIANQIFSILPLFLARHFLVTEAAQREVLLALVIGGVFYSFPIIIELRLSPQIHNWIYGFMQHDFIQTVRSSGYRPMVFLYHGLLVAFFIMTACIAAVVLWRAGRSDRRTPYLLAAGYLGLMLALCKTLSATLYGLFLLPLVLFTSRRLQIGVAAALAVFALSYPVLRGAGYIPVDAMLEQAAWVEEDRARSLKVRFDNEADLLAHAQEKILFGWGGWRRNVIYDANGKSDSITDGRWIIVIGVFGWCGYLVEFGLLTLPLLFLAGRAYRLPSSDLTPYVGALALLHGVNLIDLLPNSSLTPFTWLMTGALLGYVEVLQGGRIPAMPAPGITGLQKAPRTIL